MKKVQLFLVMLFVSCLTVAAQNLTVTGKVTYADDGSPVIGATISVKGTNVAVLSDVNGAYKITIPTSTQLKVLEFSFTGLQTKEVSVSQSGNIDVSLAADTKSIEEVVVVGYGSARRPGELVGSVAKVSAKSIENRPSASVMDALAGQVPGLQVYTSAGRPGDSQSIRLHGVGSEGASNSPLYILDGMAVGSQTIMAMNPNDLESVSVLKDASATSIYGSRAANGVIVYTTKRGVAGDKGKITVSAQYGTSSAANKSFYQQLMSTDELFNFWVGANLRTQAQVDATKNSLRNSGVVDKDGNLFNTKWYDYLIKDAAPTYQTDISFRGGAKNISYFIAGSQYHETGLVPGEFFDRYTLRSNIDARLTSWAKVGVNLALSYDKRMANGNWGGANTVASYTSGGLSFLLQPYISPIDKDGNRPNRVLGSTMWNPYYAVENTPDIYNRYGALTSAFAEFEPVDNLKIRTQFGVDFNENLRDYKRMPSYEASLNNGQVLRQTGTTYNATMTNTIEYSFVINDDHKFNFYVGQEGVSNNYRYYAASSTGQTDDRLMNLNNGVQSTYSMSSSASKSTFLSYFAHGDYSFLGKYFVDLSFRNDASSRFGKNNKNAGFWSAGAMWNMSSEDFMASTKDWLSSLNLKVSYGTQGNAGIGDYAHLGTVGSIGNYNANQGWGVTAPGDPNLSWEVQKKLTVAVNASLWNRLHVNVEFYNRVTDKMLFETPIPSTTGFTAVTKNIAGKSNTGIDLSIRGDILSGKDYYLSAYVNFNYNKEKITSLFDGRQSYEIPNTGIRYVVGKPVMFYYALYAGVNPQTGEMQWYLPGDNIDITTKDPNRVTSDYDENKLMQNTGCPYYAPTAGGFGLNAFWKGFGLAADFSFALGKSLFSNDRFFSENPANFVGYNTSKNVLDYWKKPGDITYYPDWSQFPVMEFDSHLLENASFCRMKNLTLSYTLGRNILGKNNPLSSVRAYVTGRNLLTFTSKDFRGTDPEPDTNLTYGRILNTKQLVFGVEIVF